MKKENSPQQPTNIVLMGAAYSEHKGAAALLMSAVTSLPRTFPNAKFAFFSCTPSIDRKNLKMPNVYVAPYSFKVPSFLFEFAITSIYLRLSRNRPPHNIPTLEALSKADIILDLSGDSFASEYGTLSILLVGSRIISAKILGKPIVLYCQSIGPFEGVIDRNLAKFFLKLADLTIAREYITASNLRTLGFDVPVCADQAFLLQPVYNSTKLQLPENKCIIGVNLSQHIDAMYGGGEQASNKYRQIMSQFIDCLIERYNAHILIIPEVRKKEINAYDDYFVARRIFKMLKHQQQVTIVEDNLNPSELKGIVRYCDILISPRFHLVIFGLSQNVPSIAITYLPKADGIMAMMGQSKYVVHHKDMTSELLIKKVDELFENKTIIKKEIKLKIAEMQARAQSAAGMVKYLLDEKNGR